MNEPLRSEAEVQLGFDYVAAVSELLNKFTYKEIAERIGYRSTGSVTAVLEGRIPSHSHGEALWLLYKVTFGRRPPLSGVQLIANSLTGI